MDSRLSAAGDLLTNLGITPSYLIDICGPGVQLSQAEHAVVFSPGNTHTVAFTSPVLDLLFHQRLRYEWRGRGFCVVIRKSVLSMTLPEVLGTIIHEAGHFVSWFDHPARNDQDTARAVMTWAKGGMCGADGGHNSRWVRATVHLWWRSLCLGHSIPIGNVMNGEQYGMRPERELSEALLPECSQRDDEPLEQILASNPPAAFARLFGEEEKPTQIVESRSPSPKPRPKQLISVVRGGSPFGHGGGSFDIEVHRVG